MNIHEIQIKIGNKMLRSLGADIYNSLFENIK